MDDHTARQLTNALQCPDESLRWLPQRLDRAERIVERMEWAVQEMARLVERYEELAQRERSDG